MEREAKRFWKYLAGMFLSSINLKNREAKQGET